MPIAAIEHGAVNETLCLRPRSFPETKRSHAASVSTTMTESAMRSLIFGAMLIAVAAVGFHTFISASLAAARDARAATFSERFSPVLRP